MKHKDPSQYLRFDTDYNKVGSKLKRNKLRSCDVSAKTRSITVKKQRRKHPKTIKNQGSNNTSGASSCSESLKKIKARLHDLCHKKKNEYSRSFYSHFHKRYLIAFAEFIDNPLCYDKGLLDLFYCQSKLKPLQKRQRETLVKVTAALFSRLEVESYQIGFCNTDYMDTIAHSYKDENDTRESIRDIYQKMWNESISVKRYYAALKFLKLADLYCSESIYRYEPDMEKRNPRERSEEDEIPTIKSHASYKWFTHRFFRIFKLDEHDDVKLSRDKSIKNRAKKGLSIVWVTYQAFSNSFYSMFWTKRKVPDADRYKQRQEPEWSVYGSAPLPDGWAHH